jgi:hypothetical protein
MLANEHHAVMLMAGGIAERKGVAAFDFDHAADSGEQIERSIDGRRTDRTTSGSRELIENGVGPDRPIRVRKNLQD